MCLNLDGKIFPAKCLTESGNYPDEPCVFPFKYKDRVFNGCIPEKEGGKAWCSTEVDADGDLVENKWGYCSSECTTKCNSPSDYTYNNVTGIYYKAVLNPKETWEDASDACTSEGATLIEHRKAAEHQVLEEMFGK